MRYVLAVLAVSTFGTMAIAQPLSISPGPLVSTSSPPSPDASPVRMASASPNLGGGFIEFLFGGGRDIPSRAPSADYPYGNRYPGTMSEPDEPAAAPFSRHPGVSSDPVRPAIDPKFRRQLVDYDGPEQPGTVIINTRERFLYLVQGDGRAMRYGIGVGRPGFTWAGVKQVSMKREWPDWRPPADMLKRRPDLPRYMPGGPENPLGARAMYLGSSLYRIHGSNEPWTIGQAVSSGCIRMRNEDVVDLYDRVRVGTKVIVI